MSATRPPRARPRWPVTLHAREGNGERAFAVVLTWPEIRTMEALLFNTVQSTESDLVRRHCQRMLEQLPKPKRPRGASREE
jgi:hypothetical protein